MGFHHEVVGISLYDSIERVMSMYLYAVICLKIGVLEVAKSGLCFSSPHLRKVFQRYYISLVEYWWVRE